jgi:hypothetical protein
MRVEQVMLRSGAVRRAGDPLPRTAPTASRRPAGVVGVHSVIMVVEALRPHVEYLVRAGFVVLAIDWRTVVSTATAGVAPRETGASSGLLNSSRQIGGSLGLTLSAALLVAAVLISLTALRRTSPPSRAEQADDRDCSPGLTGNPATPSPCCTQSRQVRLT